MPQRINLHQTSSARDAKGTMVRNGRKREREKNTVDGMKSRLDEAEDRISELEDKVEKIHQERGSEGKEAHKNRRGIKGNA